MNFTVVTSQDFTLFSAITSLILSTIPPRALDQHITKIESLISENDVIIYPNRSARKQAHKHKEALI